MERQSVFESEASPRQEQPNPMKFRTAKPKKQAQGQTPEPVKRQGEVFLIPQPESVHWLVSKALIVITLLSIPMAGIMLASMVWGARGFVAHVATGAIAIPLAFLAGYCWVLLSKEHELKVSLKGLEQKPDAFALAAESKLPRWVFYREIPASKCPAWLYEQRTYGIAGDLAQATGKFSAENIAAGEAGEKATALLLNAVADIPGVRVFHGLSWGNNGADIDHAVLFEDRVALIDSKQWSGVKHVMDGKGQILSVMADGSRKERTIRFHRSRDAIQQALPGADVRCFLAVHGDAEFERNPSAPLGMDSPERAIEQMMHWLTYEPGEKPDVVPVHLNKALTLHDLVKSPLGM